MWLGPCLGPGSIQPREFLKKKDKERLIESIRKLNAKEDLDDVVDKEEVIRYLAVHRI